MSQAIKQEDMERFKAEILTEIKTLFQNYFPAPYKRWLKTDEVRRLLKISGTTLLRLRRAGVLRYTRLGKIIYYDQDYVQQLFLNNLNEMQFE